MGCQTFLPCKSQEMARSKFLINNYMKDLSIMAYFSQKRVKLN